MAIRRKVCIHLRLFPDRCGSDFYTFFNDPVNAFSFAHNKKYQDFSAAYKRRDRYTNQHRRRETCPPFKSFKAASKRQFSELCSQQLRSPYPPGDTSRKKATDRRNPPPAPPCRQPREGMRCCRDDRVSRSALQTRADQISSRSAHARPATERTAAAGR